MLLIISLLLHCLLLVNSFNLKFKCNRIRSFNHNTVLYSSKSGNNWFNSLTNGLTNNNKPNSSKLIKQIVENINAKPLYYTNIDDNSNIIQLINDLSISLSTNKKLYKIEGEWKLLWTTEKETLYFAKNGLLGKSCDDIIQSIYNINSSNGQLINLIKFQDNAEFKVNGIANIDNEINNRINFKFEKVNLKYWFIKLSLPPVGKGWFSTVYSDDNIRISTDIRGDYSVFQRT